MDSIWMANELGKEKQASLFEYTSMETDQHYKEVCTTAFKTLRYLTFASSRLEALTCVEPFPYF